MLSVVLAIVAAACFIFMLIALSYAIDLDKKLERVEAELEECRRNRRVSHNPSNPNRIAAGEREKRCRNLTPRSPTH